MIFCTVKTKAGFYGTVTFQKFLQINQSIFLHFGIMSRNRAVITVFLKRYSSIFSDFSTTVMALDEISKILSSLIFIYSSKLRINFFNIALLCSAKISRAARKDAARCRNQSCKGKMVDLRSLMKERLR